ncbi:hypothetical protein [Devosia sp.]|uniref:hypothetical protein n=1 Tax=Devosia sp. TaxID=1871048 RepID=UPI0032641BD0
MKKIALMICAILLFTGPVLAQFPPPGIYKCVDAAGTDFGTLTLFAAGDYEITSTVIPSGKGQVASAGTSVNALTGPLANIHLKGSFSSNDMGEATFIFDTDKGKLQCDLPPL